MTSDRNEPAHFFHVPCEVQIRFRELSHQEMTAFQQFGLRPSPYTQLRVGIESEISRMSFGEESRTVMEKAFQILINIDQRLERLEELIQAQISGTPVIKEGHEWVQADLSAGGMAFIPATPKPIKVGDHVLLDLILPGLPEQRVVAVADVTELQGEKVNVKFNMLHQDDKEAIHRFVLEREREILRSKALERDQKPPSS